MASMKTLLVVILASVAISASSPIDFTEDQENKLKLSDSKATYGKRQPGDKQIYNEHISEGDGSEGLYQFAEVYGAPEGHVISYVEIWGDHGQGYSIAEPGYGIGETEIWLLFRNAVYQKIDLHVEVYAIKAKVNQV